MSIERMADRSLPLAERVRLALLDPQSIGVSATAHRDELVADIAAADELARATSAWYVAMEELDPDGTLGHSAATEYEMDKAEAAYRARMAQGVTHG